MKSFRFKIIILAILIPVANMCWSQTIFVSVNGNDLNTGTSQKPLATLMGARNKARQLRKQSPSNKPIEVIIQKGSYFMTKPLVLTMEDNGTTQSPLIFKGDQGGKPIFYGGKQLGKFEKVNDSLWKINIPDVKKYGWYFEQLFVNGKRAQRAQVINNNLFLTQTPLSVTQTIIQKDSIYANSFAVQKVTVPLHSTKWLDDLSKEELQDAVITFYHKWDITRRHLAAYSLKDTALYVTGQEQKPWNRIDQQSLFNIENIKSALDTAGEWFLDRSGTLFYKPLIGEIIANTTAMAPVCDGFIKIKGDEKQDLRVSNIRFENLSFQVSKYNMPLGGNDPQQGAADIDAAITMNYTNNISFINCEIAHTGGAAIWFKKACNNGLVQRCYLHDIGANGVKVGIKELPLQSKDLTKNIIVDNNIITNGGTVFPCAVAVMIMQASDNELTHNEISNFNYSGVSVGWTWGYSYSPAKRNKIAFNNIHHLGWGILSDMGGIYTLGQSEGTVVANNVVHDICSFSYGGWGLYTDEGSSGIIMENNLVYNCGDAGFHQHYGKENKIRNNIFANNLNAQLQATRVEKHLSFSFTNNVVYFDKGTLLASIWDSANIKSDSNCYWDTHTTDIKFKKQSFKEWQASGKDEHSFIENPGFEDVKNNNFTLTNSKLLQKINFKLFDYLLAGVYGTQQWKNQAKLNPKTEQEFEKAVAFRKHK